MSCMTDMDMARSYESWSRRTGIQITCPRHGVIPNVPIYENLKRGKLWHLTSQIAKEPYVNIFVCPKDPSPIGSKHKLSIKTNFPGRRPIEVVDGETESPNRLYYPTNDLTYSTLSGWDDEQRRLSGLSATEEVEKKAVAQVKSGTEDEIDKMSAYPSIPESEFLSRLYEIGDVLGRRKKSTLADVIPIMIMTGRDIRQKGNTNEYGSSLEELGKRIDSDSKLKIMNLEEFRKFHPDLATEADSLLNSMIAYYESQLKELKKSL